MIVLGIDPGTKRAGYGAVLKEGSTYTLLCAGILQTSAKEAADILSEIKISLDKIISDIRPDCLATEKLYFSKNQKTALAVAEARGIILLAAKEKGLPILEFSPNEVKLGITGYGMADKKDVLKMVRLILKSPNLKIIDDASDALALAILGGDRMVAEKKRINKTGSSKT